MSRFGMGYGKDPPKDIQGTRPAVRIHSARCQEVLNKWFQTGDKQRPEWFETKHKPRPKVGGADLGEWKLIWRPRSRMDSPTMPARKVLNTLKDDQEKEKIRKLLAQGLTKGMLQESENKTTVPTEELRVASRASKRLHTAGSARSEARSDRGVGEGGGGGEGGEGEGDDMRPRSRVGTASSRRSRSVLSVSSTVTRSSSVLMDRIKGLEDALKTEQQLRQKMQSMIALETWAE